MKSASSPCQFLQSWARNHVSSQRKPDNPTLLFDAWSGPLEPPIGCLRFFSREGRLCAPNLGEKKANVKRNADNKCTKQNDPTHGLFQCGTHKDVLRNQPLGVVFPLLVSCK